MKHTWHVACDAAGLPRQGAYDGTRHSRATEWKRQGVDNETIGKILGHRDRRSTERYARLADQAVLDMVRPRKSKR